MNSRNAVALALAGAIAAPAVPAQTCNTKVLRSAPNSRYIVNASKGTALDKRTGLTWKRCVEGRSGTDCGTGGVALLTWDAALRQAAASDFAGYKDWRLPSIKELQSLVEVACYDPAINVTVFPIVPPLFLFDHSNAPWSSSISTRSMDYAWYIGFGSVNLGDTNYDNRYERHAVRLVRGGQ